MARRSAPRELALLSISSASAVWLARPAPFRRLGPPLSYGHFPRERGKTWWCAISSGSEGKPSGARFHSRCVRVSPVDGGNVEDKGRAQPRFPPLAGEMSARTKGARRSANLRHSRLDMCQPLGNMGGCHTLLTLTAGAHGGCAKARPTLSVPFGRIFVSVG